MIELLRILLDTCNNDLIKYISVYGTIAQHIYISALGPGNNSNQSANVYCQTWNPISNCEDAFNQKHLKETNKKKFYKNTLGANLIPNQYRFQNCPHIGDLSNQLKLKIASKSVNNSKLPPNWKPTKISL